MTLKQKSNIVRGSVKVILIAVLLVGLFFLFGSIGHTDLFPNENEFNYSLTGIIMAILSLITYDKLFGGKHK